MAVQTVAPHRRRSRRVYWLYLIPGAVALAVVILIPFGLNLWYSLHRWKGGLAPQIWVGLDNYRSLLHDSAFWNSFQNSLWMILAMVVLPTLIGLLLAAVLFDYIGKNVGSRTASVLLGLWCLLTGYDAHRGNITELLKNATMAGGFFALSAVGAGTISLFGGAPGGLFAYLP